MKVCLIPSAKLTYESESTLYAINLIKYMSKYNIEVHVICQSKPNIYLKNVYFYELYILEHPVIDDYPITNEQILSTIFKISEKINELEDAGINFDVIHSHYATFNNISAIVSGKILNKIPLVVSCFGRDVFNGMKNDYRYKNMIEFGLNYTDYIICSNASVCCRIKEICNNKKVSILPMPIDNKFF